MTPHAINLCAGGWLFLVALGQTACSTTTPINAVEILVHDRCATLSAGVQKIRASDMAAIRGSVLIGGANPIPTTDPGLQLFAVSHGQQPTPGYHFGLQGASVTGQTATIELTWIQPAVDAILAQVITNPCIVVGLDPGSYAQVRAIDRSGNVIGEASAQGR